MSGVAIRSMLNSLALLSNIAQPKGRLKHTNRTVRDTRQAEPLPEKIACDFQRFLPCYSVNAYEFPNRLAVLIDIARRGKKNMVDLLGDP